MAPNLHGAMNGTLLLRHRRLSSSIEELRTGDDALYYRTEAVFVVRQFSPQVAKERFIRQLKIPVESIGQQLAGEIVDEILLAVGADVVAQAFQPLPLFSVGKERGGLDGAVAEVEGAAFADGAETFENQPKGVDAVVTGGTRRVGAVLCQCLGEREV